MTSQHQRDNNEGQRGITGSHPRPARQQPDMGNIVDRGPNSPIGCAMQRLVGHQRRPGGPFRFLCCLETVDSAPTRRSLARLNLWLAALSSDHRSRVPPASSNRACRRRRSRPPTGPLWVHEIKHDGYRLMVRRDGGRVRCFTRNGHDWADRFTAIVAAALRLKTPSFLIDGEAGSPRGRHAGLPGVARHRRGQEAILVRVRPD